MPGDTVEIRDTRYRVRGYDKELGNIVSQNTDWLLENCGVVGTPGVGFGECGEGYFRLTAFGDAEKTKVAAQRIKAAIPVSYTHLVEFVDSHKG